MAGGRALTFTGIDSDLVTQSQQKPAEHKRTDGGQSKEIKGGKESEDTLRDFSPARSCCRRVSCEGARPSEQGRSKGGRAQSEIRREFYQTSGSFSFLTSKMLPHLHLLHRLCPHCPLFYSLLRFPQPSFDLIFLVLGFQSEGI